MRKLYWITLLSIILGFLTAYFIKIDVSSSSRGIIRSEKENTSINTIISGRIQFINLKNNQKVTKGDTLLIVEDDQLEVQNHLKKDLQSDYYTQIHDLNLLISKGKQTAFNNLQTAVFQKELALFNQKTIELEVKLKQTKRSFDRSNALFKEGVIARSEFEEAEYEYEASLMSLNSLKEQQKSTWQAKKRDLQETIKNIRSDINQLHEQQESYVITAPIGREIVNYSGLQKGSFLNVSTTIAEIAPRDDLIVECYISTNDIGLIQKHQNVNLQIDAYNYNQWGLAKAQVIDIDQNITLEENNSFFKVRYKLLQNYLTLPNGYKGELKKGMTLTARFILQKRTLWEILYDDLDDWLNPHLVSN
ncbi:hypothetical protein UJ101_01384 [Flavobacteriaceae bacterium UJ101]|nr:hypothetical protein UJ101_01384 [Flavobacteriaceae bacterium UJ101]